MFPELLPEEVDYVIAKVREWDQANAATATKNWAWAGAATCASLQVLSSPGVEQPRKHGGCEVVRWRSPVRRWFETGEF
jgi:hypothetical protein